MYFVRLPPVILFEIYGHGPVLPKRIADTIKQLKYPSVSVTSWCALVIMASDCEAGTGNLMKRAKKTDSVACNKKERAKLSLISTVS